MEKNKKTSIITLIIIAIAFLVIGIFVFQKFMSHESSQNDRISLLEARVNMIDSKDDINENSNGIIWNGGGYNYLAIGNSITKHPIVDYWWNECGMAATSAENDYYHIVLNHVKETNDEVSGCAYNFAIWETLYTDRAETLEVLDHYLDGSLDLVTVQLGENVQNLDTFESDFEYLINHIHTVAPSAEIIVIGDFWENENRDEIKRTVSEKCGAIYISLNEIKDNKEYQCGMGTEVYDKDGKSYIVEHSGVAAHPNDKAMEYIANKIIENINN